MRAYESMTPEEAEYSLHVADVVDTAITEAMVESPRSEWAAANKIGVSDIGGCREYVRRTIINEPYSDPRTEFGAAFAGTAIGDLAEQAMKRKYGDGVDVQVRVEVPVKIGPYALVLPGHPDCVTKDACLDFKSRDRLGVIRREGPPDKEKFQVSFYTKALIDSGRLPKDAWCVLCYIDRSGKESKPVVFAWRYDPHIIELAEQWIEDVVYAVENNEEASRDMPRSWCEACCPRFTACRVPDTDVEGLIRNPEMVAAVLLHEEAKAAAKQAKNDIDAAKAVLKNVYGSTGQYVVRWVHVNPDGKAAYDRLDIRPAPAAPTPEEGS